MLKDQKNRKEVRMFCVAPATQQPQLLKVEVHAEQLDAIAKDW